MKQLAQRLNYYASSHKGPFNTYSTVNMSVLVKVSAHVHSLEGGGRSHVEGMEHDGEKAKKYANHILSMGTDPCMDATTVHAVIQMRALEDERLRALEAAARARSEVTELTESRRKLQWQSKLLEKMSEVWCAATAGVHY